MLQNESVDEDLEHFEDIAEEEEDKTTLTQNGTDFVDRVIGRNDGIRADNVSSSDEDSPAASDSEDGDMDEPGSLLVADGLDNLKESEPVSEGQEQESEASNVKSVLPGGYNPRHREPSFWYFRVL